MRGTIHTEGGESFIEVSTLGEGRVSIQASATDNDKTVSVDIELEVPELDLLLHTLKVAQAVQWRPE